MGSFKNIRDRFTPQSVLDRKKSELQKRQLAEWENSGRPVPPPHIVKQNIIKEYRQKSGYDILIETGTFLGDMVAAQLHSFQKIFSIELGEELCRRAQQRFSKNKNVKIIQGDSGKVLPQLIKEINTPGIFWLDGHYSAGPTARGDKDCPIYEELTAIFSGPALNHILLVDDARLFNGTNDYPTLEALSAFVKQHKPGYRVEVKDDVIRFTPEL